MNKRKLERAAAFLVILLILLIIVGLVQFSEADKNGDIFKVVEIQGMPCVKWSNLHNSESGLTCNWDEWEGEDD